MGNASAPDDFTLLEANLTFSAAAARQYVTLMITDDLIAEMDEDLYIFVQSNDPVCVAGQRARVTIVDDGEYNSQLCT